MTRRLLAVMVTALALVACGPTGSAGVSGGGPGGAGGDGSQTPGGGGGTSGGDPSNGGLTPTDPGATCASVTAEATRATRPADIIVVIDNSGSMTAEIGAVERNINVNFADILQASGIDYRVIMLSGFGLNADNGICVRPPLGGNTACDVAAGPVNTARYFHYDRTVSSTNSWSLIDSTYAAPDGRGLAPGGWSQWLRDGAVKVFIEITDDRASYGGGVGTGTPSQRFENGLLAKTPAKFGAPGARDFIWHTIGGMIANTPPTTPWVVSDPVVTQTCPGGVNAGLDYQELSIRTGGLRFPVCEGQSFDAVFRAAAGAVTAAAQTPCDLGLPPTPPGHQLSKAFLKWTRSDTTVEHFAQVADPGACAAGGFYVEGSRVKVCPQTCARIQSDPAARIDVFFSCTGGIN